MLGTFTYIILIFKTTLRRRGSISDIIDEDNGAQSVLVYGL